MDEHSIRVRQSKMKSSEAIKLALGCIDKDLQRLAFDANLFEIYHAEHGQKAWKKRERLREAKEMLSQIEADNLITRQDHQTKLPL